MHLNLSFMGNCEVTDSSGIHHGWPLTVTPKDPSPAARHSTWKWRCKAHQTCSVRSSSVVSPILLQVQNMLAHGWGHHLWQETHPLLQWEDEAVHTAWGRQWPRCRGSLSAGAAFCIEPAPGQQVPAGSSGLCHQLSLGGIHSLSSMNVTQSWWAKLSPAKDLLCFPQVTQGCFCACVGICPADQKAG